MQKLNRWNKGNKYLLTVIDVLSKYAWAAPIKSKRSQDMIRGLEGIRRQASPRRPLRVQTDPGKEFYNRGVQAWFKKHGWHHFRRMGIVRPLWWNDGIAPCNNGCIVTLQPTIRYGSGCVTTIDPYVQSRLSSGYWDGPASSHTQNRARRPHPPNVKWAIAYASTRIIVLSKQAIYRHGKKKCL